MECYFKEETLFDYMTVEENIMFPLTMFTNQSTEEKLDRVNFCLKRVNLENKNNYYLLNLSGGMLKELNIKSYIYESKISFM